MNDIAALIIDAAPTVQPEAANCVTNWNWARLKLGSVRRQNGGPAGSGQKQQEYDTGRIRMMSHDLQSVALTPVTPWKVSFSYGRALQDPALEAWHGRDENLAGCRPACFLPAGPLQWGGECRAIYG